jgi:hypothetical protein
MESPRRTSILPAVILRPMTPAKNTAQERLLAQMQSPDVTLDGLLADVRKFANGTGLRDDATVILVRARRTESGSQRERLTRVAIG